MLSMKSDIGFAPGSAIPLQRDARTSMTSPRTSEILARLDRLPATRHIWKLVLLLSLGGCFEFYDLFLTAYITPGLIAAKIFSANRAGLFGLSDQATFAASNFAGLFIGTILFAQITDKVGRKLVFTWSLIWYTAAIVVMGFQNSAPAIDIWRFIAGIGIGVELVTIDTYIAELIPRHVRGRAFAINQCIQFSAVPMVALCCWMFIGKTYAGVPGWRIVILLSSIGAALVWFIQKLIPESPRWLILHGKVAQAEAITSELEKRVREDIGTDLPAVGKHEAEQETAGTFSEVFLPPYRRRTIMLVVFNFFQTIGFYGFGNWVPSLLASQGTSVLHSLQYSFIIAIAYPVGPLICSAFADRFERKWQIIAAGMGTAILGLTFARQSAPAALICLGVAITLSNNLLSYSYHAYQAELFPTRIRARAVGFVYSWSRLSTVLTSFMIGFLLRDFGSRGVFAFIAASMGVVILIIGVFGPKTNGLELEAIS